MCVSAGSARWKFGQCATLVEDWEWKDFCECNAEALEREGKTEALRQQAWQDAQRARPEAVAVAESLPPSTGHGGRGLGPADHKRIAENRAEALAKRAALMGPPASVV